MLPLLCLAALPPAVELPAPQAFAPDVGLERWLEPEREGEERVSHGTGGTPEDMRRMMEQARPGQVGQLAELHGRVVVIHAIDWEGETREGARLSLLRELAEANQDRALSFLGLAPEREEEAARERLDALGIDWPVGLAGEGASCPYLGLEARTFVVGPNRALLFVGDELEDEAGFLEAIQSAFLRPVAPRVERALAPELDEAWTLYAEGELAKAAKVASKLEKKARKAGHATLANDAAELDQLVQKARTEWIAALRGALSASDGATFARRKRDLERAFPRGEAKAELEAVEQEARQRSMFTFALRDNELWFEAEADRPPLFPLRRSRAGDAYAKQLEKLLKATSNSLDVTRVAERMLRRYRGEKS